MAVRIAELEGALRDLQVIASIVAHNSDVSGREWAALQAECLRAAEVLRPTVK